MGLKRLRKTAKKASSARKRKANFNKLSPKAKRAAFAAMEKAGKLKKKDSKGNRTIKRGRGRPKKKK